MDTVGWLILLGSLFGLLAPLAAYEDPHGGGISLAALQTSNTIIFLAALAPHTPWTFISRATALVYSANLVQGNPTGPRHSQLPRDTTEVDSISTCTPQGAEYAGKSQQHNAEHTWTVNDQVAYRSAILVCGEYHFRRWQYVTDLSADYNELISSNASLSQQVAELTSSLQASYDYSRTLGKYYAKLLEENDKLRKSNLRMSVLHKRALDTNGTGSTNASTNATTSSTNQTIGERLATLEAKSKSSTDPQWKTLSTEVFLVVGWIGPANGFLVMLLDNWWPRLIWFLATFLSLFNSCWNTKPFQDRIKKKWPTKSTLASEVKSHVADHTVGTGTGDAF
ncbi:hypothetical protein GQ607_014885 [Colletotrichum asianum]|uniref:Uncharacterized protein n=1 Tax=Colletotrichum asianum TaxID=702518 RepID=A0A8H3ZLC0_9PEZI|nr:hypothetical protein GQ607_014885 [Colletotrichum asianum]